MQTFSLIMIQAVVNACGYRHLVTKCANAAENACNVTIKRNRNDQLLAPPRTTHDIRLTGIFQDNSDKPVLE